MRYKIGDVAKILGISPDLIRYYEEKGVVSPEKDPHNNYRYYDTWAINYLIDCLWYKNFGFGIDKIAQMGQCSYDKLLDCFEEKCDEMTAAIRRQELLLERTLTFHNRLKSTKDSLGKCVLCDSAEFVKYINRRDFEYGDSPELRGLTRQWLKYMPFSRRYFEFQSAESEAGYSWGFSLDMEYVGEFGVEIKPPVELMSARQCIHSAFKSAGKDKFTARHIDFMLDFARENGLEIAAPAFGNIACSVVEDGVPTGYFEVWLPVDATLGGVHSRGTDVVANSTT